MNKKKYILLTINNEITELKRFKVHIEDCFDFPLFKQQALIISKKESYTKRELDSVE